MKRLPAIITVVLFVVFAGGYYLYTNFKNPTTQPWDLVPQETILVYEPGDCKTCVDAAQATPVWQILKKAALYSKPTDSLQQVYELFDGDDQSRALISLHATKKDDFDFVFYNVVTASLTERVNKLIEKSGKGKSIRYSDREFNSVKIQEISSGKNIFSWAVIDNIWIGSFTPFLVEDVVRTYEAGNVDSFKKDIVDVYQLPRTGKDAGNLYVHLPHFSKWISLFSDEPVSSILKNLGRAAILDAKVETNNFVFNGFSTANAAATSSTLSLFDRQAPVPFALKQWISNRTIMFTSYGISDGKVFGESLTALAKKQNAGDSLSILAKELDIDVNSLYDNLKGEIGTAYLESKGTDLSRIVLVQTAAPETWMNALNKLSAKVSIDTIFFERFSDYEIRELPVYEFPEKLLGPLVTGFKTTYYTSLANTIFLCEDIEELKKFLEDIDREDTWGKSVSQNQFLETTLLEANLSLYVNTSKIWSTLSSSLNPRWTTFIKDNQALLRSLRMGAIQFSHLNENFYTNIAWSYGNVKQRKEDVPAPVADGQKVTANFNHNLYKAFVVKSHANRNNELFIQDSSHNVSLISSDGKVLWSIALDQPIAGDVQQVDFFKNGKLQYLFATSSKLHIVDRLGNYVAPYPVTLKVKDADKFSIIDYDHSKKYRFLVTGKSGKLWMYDKEGKALDGWTPKNVDGPLLVSPAHHRIRGKDYVLAIRTDGVVYLMNRRGETLKNFPLKLEAKLAGDYFLEIGKSMTDTYFVVVTKDGFRIKFNLEGKIHNRETLIKTSIDAQFSLVRDWNEHSYLIARQEGKRLTLLDEGGKEVVKNDFVGMDPVQINYYNFGSGKIYFTITDLTQDLSYVYDDQGNLISSPPLESHWVDVRPADGEKVVVYTMLQKMLSTQVLPQ